ncbi:MAG: hypothetical protein IKJ42_05320 [Bacteroidaceae bacterium]|nr:hypothetical protein [Bacteroidaceae bacterium]
MSPTHNTGNAMLVRLKVLLTTELKKILSQEAHNDNHIHLYEAGEYWVAFEKSAYQLGQLTDDAERTMVLRVKNHPFPIIMRSIHYKRLDDVCHKHIIVKKSLDYLQLVAHPVDRKSYGKWYSELLVEGRALFG